MATTTQQTTDVTAVLESLLTDIPDLRVYTQILDSLRPPCVVIAQPTLTFNDPESGFCAASWAFGLTLLVSRNQDRAAQSALSQGVLDIVSALDAADPAGVLAIEPQDATPVSITLGRTEVPGVHDPRPDQGVAEEEKSMAINHIKTLTLELDSTQVECQLTTAQLVDEPEGAETLTILLPEH